MDANLATTLRQLQRAEGYIELHLPERALEELNLIRNDGSVEPAVELLRGEALASQERYPEAVDSLKRAARLIPAPLNKRAWRSLSHCYRQSGHEELAEIAELVANESEAAAERPRTIHIAIVPIQITAEAVQHLINQLACHEGADKDAPPDLP